MTRLAIAVLAAGLMGAGLAAAAAEDDPKEHPAPAAKKDAQGHPAPAGQEEPAHGKADATGHAKPVSPKRDPTGLDHVMDSSVIHFFETLHLELHLPKIGGFQITKFMVLEVIAALLVCAIYIPLARRLQRGQPPRGAWDNTFEALLTFVRNEIAKPNLGAHDADRYVPFLWTMFLFILFNNLLGLFPFGGSATASITVTAVLALCVFFAIHGSAVAKMGFVHYLETLWPHIDVPFPLGYVIKPVIFVIEVVGVLVRNGVLAVRLFANMFAGHMVLATILIFIFVARNTTPALWGVITVSSVLGIVALSLLELFVAFLQAYIFVFLTSLFIGMAVHPQH
jgi:F-type H+-transporting ATPase subunit a